MRYANDKDHLRQYRASPLLGSFSLRLPAGGTSVGSSAGRVAKPSLRGGRFGQRGDDSAGGCARVAGHFT